MITLYHWWGSTCSRKARMTLHEKGVEWESKHIDLHEFENWQPWYVKIHPKGVVPALDHDGRIVIESNAILEYLDDVYPDPPLRPADPWERARMRVWLDKSEHILHKNMHLISHNRVHAHRWREYAAKHSEEELKRKVSTQPDPQRQRDEVDHAEHGIPEEAVSFAVDRIVEELDNMERDLEPGPWMTGETFSLADIAVLPFVERFIANGFGEHVEPAARPCLADWFTRIMSRSAVKQAYAFTDPNTESG